MSYRFVKVTTFYRDYLSYYYKKNNDVVNLSYDEQYKKVMYDSFGWADFFQTNLSKLGVDAYEIIYNATSLQKAWAREHSVSLDGKELLIEQLKEIKPDVVFFQDSDVFNGAWIDYIREKVPSIKLVIGWCCNPYTENHLELFKNFDFMITCSPAFNIKFKEYGLRSYQLSHAFEKSILQKIKSSETKINSDFLFIGNLIQSGDFHNFRTSLIESLLKSDINFKLYSKLVIVNPFLLFSQKSAYIFSKFLIAMGGEKIVMNNQLLKKVAILNEIPRKSNYSDRLKKVAEPTVFGLDMFNALSNSKICLNIHGGVTGDCAVNMRLFEVTGVGSCLITDWKKNLNELFEIDKEVVSFKTADECIEKVKWLLDHPIEMEHIAKAGQQRTLKDHTFEKRAQQLDEVIRRELKIG